MCGEDIQNGRIYSREPVVSADLLELPITDFI